MRFAATKGCALTGLAVIAACLTAVAGRAAEHVTLRNGFAVDCARQEADGDRVRLYFLSRDGAARDTAQANYMEVNAAEIAGVEKLPEVPASSAASPSSAAVASAKVAPEAAERLSASEIAPMLADAQSKHNVDADLLWSVVQAESARHVRAVSRVGAQGLMQLMPGTAVELGVANTFAAEQNIAGGAAYLDQLLARYHDDMTLALAAYNAGPAAVDRWHGVPPYRETRAYVARVVHQFNARKRLLAAKLMASK